MILRAAAVGIISLLLSAALILPKIKTNLPYFGSFSERVKADTAIDTDHYPNPTKKPTYQDPPQLTASSISVIDAKTGAPLYEKNPNLKHFPASIAKLMTALVALENCSPTDIITVSFVEKVGTQMGLTVGDKVTVENLLYGLLINSGNDAATVLSDNCASSREEFVQSINEKAQNLGMENSHFMNPTGFDNNYQYSTAADIARLANTAIANPLISKIVVTKSTVVTDAGGTKPYYLKNVNELLGVVQGLEGVKTGQTEGALENLVTKTTRNGNSVVVAVLGSENRFDESKILIEWAFNNFNWVSP